VLAGLGARPLPQIVLVDRDLPDQRGEDLAAALREVGLRAAILLVCSDGQGGPSRGGPVDAILHRPILRSELFRTLARLPAPEQVPPAEPSPPPASLPVAAPEPAPEAGPRPMRVLAAEDNKTNRFVFDKMVKGLDIELAFATNGHEAVELYHSFRPDLVFMDISMPGKDGKEATREIRRAEAGLSHTPVIALTAHAMAGDREEILACGLDHYLTKPLRKAEIHDCIRRHCPSVCRVPHPPGAADG
jgi:CheY-like chemotaxis protein